MRSGEVMKRAALQSSGWQAELALTFSRCEQRTVLTARHHRGPLRVQRPFYPEGAEVCHLYLLHPPGGVVGGDQLEINIVAQHAAQLVMTTPAAGKFYRSGGAEALLQQRLQVAEEATLEWLPQESIIFNGARATQTTTVELAPDAHFIGWEINCFGRNTISEAFQTGHFHSRFELWRAGRPLLLERSQVEGGSELLSAAWGLAGRSVMGTMVCTVNQPTLLERVRHCALIAEGDFFTVTQLKEVLVCRYLGDHAESAKRYFSAAWAVVRPALLGREINRPRIWST